MKKYTDSDRASKYRQAILLSVIIFTFIILAGITLSTVTYVDINDNNPVPSSENLNCYWNITETSEVNITWYKNYEHERNLSLNCTAGVECSTSIGSGTVLSSDILKGEVWTCEIQYENGTLNRTISITDTAPTIPRIFDENSTEIYNSTTVFLPEDYITLLDANSTDIDPSDTITYELNETSICNISSTTGLINCTPTTEAQIGFRKIQVRAVTDDRISLFTLSINVTATNDAPTFSPALTTTNFTNGLPKLNYRIIGIDAENNTPLNLTIINVTRDGIASDLDLRVITVNNTTFYMVLGDNRTATYWEAYYSYNVTLSLTDNDNLTNQNKSTNVTFELIGITSNDLPNISVVLYNTTALSQGDRLEVYINASDPNNDTLTFATGGLLYPINYSSETFYADVENESSWAYAWINFTPLTNDHVINRNITIYVFDTNDNATNITTLWINNANDAPELHEISNYSNNTYSNTNISDMIAYTGVPFIFKVNATDIDDRTYDSANTGIRNYSTSNMINFTINITTGILNFIPLESGNFTFDVNVTDGAGVQDTIVANIEVFNNQNPQFHSDIVLECWEFDATNYNYYCEHNLSDYVNDTDNLSGGDDYITEYWTNSTLFTVNSTTGRFNFTADQSMIGNHTILFNVTDSKGGKNSTSIILSILNTNNPPSIDSVNMPLNKMIVEVPYQIVYSVSDLDLDLNDSYELLEFNISINGTNISALSFNNISETTAVLNITPISANYEGNYSINMTVKDFYDNITSHFMWIYIYNATLPPNITQITPFGSPITNNSINTSWMPASAFNNTVTNITISENQTYTFDNTAIADDSSYPNSLTYQWSYDGSTVATTKAYNRYFNFYTSGMHNLTLTVIDEYGSNSSFYWKLNITNINRPPIYTNGTLYNLTIEGSGFLENYLTWTRQGVDFVPVFYDVDDDPEGQGYSEYDTTTLVFSSTYCPHANLSFESHRLNINAYSVGECYVIFNATDFLNASMSVSSESIFINITNISQSVQPEPEPINVETTGGGTNTEPIPIPMPEEVEKPVPLQLITPKLVTVYKNATIKVPIVINNTWNDTLAGITLEGFTNATNVTLYLDKIYIPKLNKGESTEATLYIRNYKSDGHYEIQITANVSVPRYKDTATIYINSAEMKSEGEEMENKISFAQDLLSSNPECQELNELLGQAKVELNNEDYAATAKIVDNVINGCKYLVNNANKNKEMPDRNFVKTFEWRKSYNDYLIIGFFAVLFMSSLYYILKKDNPEEEF